MSIINASLYDSKALNALSFGSSGLYTRNASIPMSSTLEDACDIGTLIKNTTQLDATSALSRSNSQQFYKFSLSGNNLKLALSSSGTGDARVQILNSSGKVVADSSTFASDSLQEAYESASSTDGLDLKSGDYYVKVSYDVTSMRSDKLGYSLSLYSGTRFATSYKTVAKPQTSEKQALLTDKTMTFSTIDAQSYSTKTAHTANENASSAINIGWLFKDKSALSISSQMTDVCPSQYYTFTLQKGDDLKFAFNNHTDTQDLRVQIMDSSGTKIIADSHGTKKQKEAYAALNSSDGLDASAGQYLIKVSYADTGFHKKQIYDFKLYSGDQYSALYTTTAGTESMSTALYSGHITSAYTMKNAVASYLTSVSQGTEGSIFDTISKSI